MMRPSPLVCGTPCARYGGMHPFPISVSHCASIHLKGPREAILEKRRLVRREAGERSSRSRGTSAHAGIVHPRSRSGGSGRRAGADARSDDDQDHVFDASRPGIREAGTRVPGDKGTIDSVNVLQRGTPEEIIAPLIGFIRITSSGAVPRAHGCYASGGRYPCWLCSGPVAASPSPQASPCRPPSPSVFRPESSFVPASGSSPPLSSVTRYGPPAVCAPSGSSGDL